MNSSGISSSISLRIASRYCLILSLILPRVQLKIHPRIFFSRENPKISLKEGTPRNLPGETCREITEETHKEIPKEKLLKEHLRNSYLI